jgi:hypothetical protein
MHALADDCNRHIMVKGNNFNAVNYFFKESIKECIAICDTSLYPILMVYASFAFGRAWIQILVWQPTILTDILCCFPQSLQAYAGIVC